MVRAVFEHVNTAETAYLIQDNPETITHDGRVYTLMGESIGRRLSCGEHFTRILGLVALIAAAIFTIIPIFFKCFRTKIADWATEVCNGAEKVVHWVSPTHPHPQRLILDQTFSADFVNAVINAYRTLSVENPLFLPPTITSAACHFLIHSNQGDPIRQQFIFRKPNEGTFNMDEFLEEFRKIEGPFEEAIAPLRDQPITRFAFDHLILLRGEERDKLYSLRGGMSGSVENRNVIPIGHSYRSSGYTKDDAPEEFRTIDFPVGEAVRNNEFIEGRYYHPLP
jgi:hypothetical protein